MDGVWYGPSAKWFEKCEMSGETNSERRADFTTWKFLPQRADMMFMGTVSPSTWTHCYCFPGLATNCQYAIGTTAANTAKPVVGTVEAFASGFY